MFTEIFSIILLKKRKKFLKLKHHDKDARLPHPNSLLIKSRGKSGPNASHSSLTSGLRKRELKQQLKEEQ